MDQIQLPRFAARDYGDLLLGLGLSLDVESVQEVAVKTEELLPEYRREFKCTKRTARNRLFLLVLAGGLLREPIQAALESIKDLSEFESLVRREVRGRDQGGRVAQDPSQWRLSSEGLTDAEKHVHLLLLARVIRGQTVPS